MIQTDKEAKVTAKCVKEGAGEALAGGQGGGKEATPEGPAARAGPSCGGEATAEGPDASADPPSKGRNNGGAFGGFFILQVGARPLRVEAAEEEGGARVADRA